MDASSADARLLICSFSEAKLDHSRSKTYWANGEACSDDELSSFVQQKSRFGPMFG